MRIFLDIDGVLADFAGAICAAHGWDVDDLYAIDDAKGVWDMAGLKEMDKRERWKPSAEVDFWFNLDKTTEADLLVDHLEDLVGVENIVLLTSPSLHPNSIVGKLAWVNKHYPQFNRQLLIGAAKHFCAGPGHILIDDADDNTKRFIEYGGEAILFPRPWNSSWSEAEKALKPVFDELHAFGVMSFWRK